MGGQWPGVTWLTLLSYLRPLFGIADIKKIEWIFFIFWGLLSGILVSWLMNIEIWETEDFHMQETSSISVSPLMMLSSLRPSVQVNLSDSTSMAEGSLGLAGTLVLLSLYNVDWQAWQVLKRLWFLAFKTSSFMGWLLQTFQSWIHFSSMARTHNISLALFCLSLQQGFNNHGSFSKYEIWSNSQDYRRPWTQRNIQTTSYVFSVAG